LSARSVKRVSENVLRKYKGWECAARISPNLHERAHRWSSPVWGAEGDRCTCVHYGSLGSELSIESHNIMHGVWVELWWSVYDTQATMPTQLVLFFLLACCFYFIIENAKKHRTTGHMQIKRRKTYRNIFIISYCSRLDLSCA
jgi:hypothetical protein